MDRDLHDRFDSLVAGLEDEFASASALKRIHNRRRFARRAVFGVVVTLVIGLLHPILGMLCFLTTVIGAGRVLSDD